MNKKPTCNYDDSVSRGTTTPVGFEIDRYGYCSYSIVKRKLQTLTISSFLPVGIESCYDTITYIVTTR